MTRKSWSPFLAVAALLGLPSRGAWAYQTDVHFNLTYVLCRLAKLPREDALWIADANQSMDDNECTTAYKDLTWWSANQDLAKRNGIHWHDLSDVGLVPGTDTVPPNGKVARYSDGGVRARLSIRIRLSQLWANVPLSKQNADERIRADIALGQYLHALQDYYSHRQFTPGYLDPNKFLPYGPHAGHTPDGDGKCADYVGLRPELAKMMAKDSYDHIAQYAEVITGQKTSSPNFSALIDALSNAYPKQNPLPTNYQADPNASVTSPSGQAAINRALASFYTDWLPVYDKDYTLPYDEHEKSLKTVKEKITSWK